jgi:hypothetical protein
MAVHFGADERGFVSMPEFLVAVVVGFLVLGIPLTLMSDSFVQTNNTTSRTASTARVQNGLSRLTHELRQAMAASINNSGGVATATLTVPKRPAGSAQVTWVCTSGGSCTRQEGAAAAVTVIDNVTSVTFSPVSRSGSTTVPSTNPSFVQISVSARVVLDTDRTRTKSPTAAHNAITVQDGVNLRNFS